jgi:hypothetical protein
MKLVDILLSLLLFVLINSQCSDDEFLDNTNSCYSIETLLNDQNEQIDISFVNYLSRDLKTISKAGYNIDFIRLDDVNLQSQNKEKSKLYISKNCINLLEKSLKAGSSVGIVIIVSNSNIKNKNGIPQAYFVIRFTGSGNNKYLSSSNYDFSLCHEDPILLSMDININEVKALKKKEKENVYDRDIYETTDINMDRVLYAKKFNIDLFDPYSQFLEDICFKFKSEKNTDVTLETRLNDYYQNVTFCDIKKNAHYTSFNYFPDNKLLVYNCAYGFFKSEKDKKNYIDEIDSKINVVFTNSNFKVITCYKEILKYKDIVKNYGEIICLFVFLMQLIFFISFCCGGTAPIEKKIDSLISNASKERMEFQKQLENENKNIENYKNKEINNNNNQNQNIGLNNNQNIGLNNNQNINNITTFKINNNIQNNNFQNNSNIQNNNNQNNNNIILNINDANNNFDAESCNEILNNRDENTPKNNFNNNYLNKFNNKFQVQNPQKKNKKRKSLKLENRLNMNAIENNGLMAQENKRRKSVNVDNNDGTLKLENLENNDIIVEEEKKTHIPDSDKKVDIINEKEKEKQEKEAKEENEDIIKKKNIISRRRSSQIFLFDNDDLNELPFDEARIFDKRHFCNYYCFMIQISNIIINTFCRCNDFNLFSIKVGLLLFLFPLNLTFNAFFFTSKEIQYFYANKITDISINWKNLTRSLISSIISSIILVFLKLICLSHHSIRKIKKEINIDSAKKKSKEILKCKKFRITLYYLFSLIFLLIFGFYVSCFCAIFENTQLLLIQSMATSWFLSLFYPFLICFFTSIFRISSLHCGKRGISCCYSINKLLQLI